MDDGDERFDLNNLEYASDSGAPPDLKKSHPAVTEHASEAVGQGVPPEVVDLLTYLFNEVVDGRNANTTDGVQRVSQNFTMCTVNAPIRECLE